MGKLVSATQAIQWAYYQGHAQKFSRLEPCLAFSTVDNRLDRLENHILAAQIMSAVEKQPKHVSEWLRYAYAGDGHYTRAGMADLEGMLLTGVLLIPGKKYQGPMIRKIEKMISLAMMEYSRVTRGNSEYSIAERCRLLNNSMFNDIKSDFEIKQYEEYCDRLQEIATKKFKGSKEQQMSAMEKEVEKLRAEYLVKERLHFRRDKWDRDYQEPWSKIMKMLNDIERQPLKEIAGLVSDINEVPGQATAFENCFI